MGEGSIRMDYSMAARIALGQQECPAIERAAMANWEGYSRNTYASFVPDTEAQWRQRAPVHRWSVMYAFASAGPSEFSDKEALIRALFDVQAGRRSCRHLASALWPLLEPYAQICVLNDVQLREAAHGA